MRKLTGLLVVLFVVVFGTCAYVVWGSGNVVLPEYKDEQAIGQAVKKLHSRMEPVRSGDWLESHDEDGQTFAQYLNAKPIKLSKKRNKLYVQPIGKFDGKKKEIIELAAEFMQIYFCCDVVVNKSFTSESFQEDARRKNPNDGQNQLLSTYILYDVLKPKLPDDAFAMIAFTEEDLWPGRGWNFVFGQASLRSRVGVWSIYRNGNPEKDFKLCLERTLKTATHETGHMFSIEHCIAYQCNMNGSNNRRESDRHPLYLCPECLPKILVATKGNAATRFKKLGEFCRKHGLDDAAEYYEATLGIVAEE